MGEVLKVDWEKLTLAVREWQGLSLPLAQIPLLGVYGNTLQIKALFQPPGRCCRRELERDGDSWQITMRPQLNSTLFLITHNGNSGNDDEDNSC